MRIFFRSASSQAHGAIGAWLLIAIAVIFVACKSSQPPIVTEVEPEVKAEQDFYLQEEITYPISVRRLDDQYFSTVPINDNLIIIGTSAFHEKDRSMADGSYLIEKETVEAALQDAARRLAMYQKPTVVTVETSTDIGMSIFDYVNESSSSVEPDADYAAYIKDFQFNPERDIFVGAKTQNIFIRVRYSTLDIPLLVDFVPSAQDGSRPSWIDDPPDILGFSVGVGFANPRVLMKEALVSSYENAACALAWRKSAEVNAEYLDAGAIDSHSTQKAKTTAHLHKFYILETWIDPKNSSVYSLAIATDIEENIDKFD
jgi:hypothetical protein